MQHPFNTLGDKNIKTNEDNLQITRLREQINENLNKIEQQHNEVRKAEITYEVLLSDKTEKDKYRTALLNVIKGDRVNRTQCQVDKNIASQKYISTLIKTGWLKTRNTNHQPDTN